jgi:hypothetical protein
MSRTMWKMYAENKVLRFTICIISVLNFCFRGKWHIHCSIKYLELKQSPIPASRSIFIVNMYILPDTFRYINIPASFSSHTRKCHSIRYWRIIIFPIFVSFSSFSCRFAEGKSDKEILDKLLSQNRYDKRLLPPVDGKSHWKPFSYTPYIDIFHIYVCFIYLWGIYHYDFN